jgi:hypothetical protein
MRGDSAGPLAEANHIAPCTEEGERLEGHQVIDLALDAIARASARA